MNSTAFILYGRPGFFFNNTNDIKGVICDWSSGKGNKFWAKEPVTPRQLNSYEQIRTMLVNGNPLQFSITLDGCQCVDGNCGHGYIGGNMAGVKISKEGTISFSKAMTLYFPVPTFPVYYRELLVGSIQRIENRGFIPVHSYDSLFSYLASGTEIRYIFNVSSCVDPDNPPQYKDIPTFGGKINHFDASPNSGDKPGQSSFNDAQFIHGKTYTFKLTKDGSIEFSSDSTTVFPIAWTYIRVITVVNVHSNNTVTFSTSRFDTVTLEESTNDMLICPIHTASSPQGVKFFVNVN
uniref:Uncharacterized protein n=1 Tax=Magallana gigas TaxID=29159 RepID=K1QTH4_MAGGI